ncbi:MAG: group 1 glycosyl transferase [Alteromonadaceae bacterium]|uniref:Glycosyl transferase n=1 Tax=Paraglaciecola chathamensis TaxID=368405 RepID=A0A8H9IAK7_9ALTE|nr:MULTISPECIES: TIGR03087 family PEP-CTERM/XrtA system glycosyltransferase [Paraglaciecola]AEE24154.1 sugar transferase, PEP-CTERM/EpsH1 system associated [Glaciecola sp. 4H-3-7+YE-5]MBN25278.1 group 1 glycosyl transferase [Alteromonadaceae bacterium]GGZ65678.1 glycosyl transferase [Paraglaciecola oceanifecundans]|tara:strand:+ start:21346 stop:22575 length:1230 start_codon:yes stop_codon:yes gene_type:complete
MKIVVLSHRVPFPANKGEKIRTYNQLKFLASKGHELHLFSPYDSDDELEYFSSLESTVCRSALSFKNNNKSWRMFTGLLSGRAMSMANFYLVTMQNALNNFLSHNAVDAIVCTASSMAEYILCNATIQALEKKPLLIMDFMDVDSDKWRQYARSSGFPMSWVYLREHRIVAQYEREISERFDVCYLIAKAEVELFSKQVISSDKVKVLGNGLDTESFYPPSSKSPDSSQVLIFTGVMDYKPNVDAVIWFVENCWSAILLKYPDARFIIAGMNPSKEVTELASGPGIEVTGFVDDILPYYQMADVFVAPFRLARGVQNKVLQAFSCALPVVATPMGAEGINCAGGEHICLATDAREFIDSVIYLLENKQEAELLGRNALKLVINEYSWEGQLSPLLEYLPEIEENYEEGS